MHHDVVSDFSLVGGVPTGSGGIAWKRNVLPKGSAMRALDEDIASEGGKVVGGDKVILSNGDQVAYTPPPEKLVMPSLEEVKSLRHYFGKKGYQVYPAWLYHKDGRKALARDHKEAAELGIVYREASTDERNRYGLRHLWDWEQDCQWRPNPWEEPKFDPANPGSGKEVVYRAPDPKIAQHALVTELIPAVAAAVAQSLKASGPAAPAHVDPAQWQQFLDFQAWQKTQEVVAGAAAAIEADNAMSSESLVSDEQPSAEDLAANALSPEQDRFLWEEEARRLGVKTDKRWGLDRLKAEVEKAMAGEARTA